jgi:hypothetical protein
MVSATVMLAELLADGPRPATECMEAMWDAGYNRHATEKAKKQLKVRSRKLGAWGGKYVWETPSYWCCPTCLRPWTDAYTPPPPVEPVGPPAFGYIDGEPFGPERADEDVQEPQEPDHEPEPVENTPVRQQVVSRQRIGLCNCCGMPGEPGERCTAPIRGLGGMT